MKRILLILLLWGCGGVIKAQNWGDLLNQAKKALEEEQKKITGIQVPTNDEIVRGLKEALNKGTNTSTTSASQLDGYLKNARLFIPFPPEAQKMKEQLVALGFQNKVTEFETSLNRAAEEAAKSAAPVFLEAVRNMTVTDGVNILKGADTSATHYLKKTTSNVLYTQYKPIVERAINKVKVTQHWSSLVKTYNKIPGVKKQNPDLPDYVTQRALSGLFLLVADEEKNIRQNPLARGSDLLKKVFGYADTQKK